MNDHLYFAASLHRLYNLTLRDFGRANGLSQTEMDVLLFLHNNPDCNTARDMVHLRGLAKSNVSTALDSLRTRGLVEIRRGRGTYVTSTGIDSASPDISGLSAVESNAREMMEIRLIIEPSIAYYAALRGTDEEIQRIDEYRIKVEEIIAAGKNRTSAEQDFHNALAAATHNQFAMQLMQVVNKSIYLEVKYHEESTNLATHSIPDHREIVNFLRRRNPDGAKTAMQMHILHAIQSSQERKK